MHQYNIHEKLWKALVTTIWQYHKKLMHFKIYKRQSFQVAATLWITLIHKMITVTLWRSTFYYIVLAPESHLNLLNCKTEIQPCSKHICHPCRVRANNEKGKIINIWNVFNKWQVCVIRNLLQTLKHSTFSFFCESVC